MARIAPRACPGLRCAPGDFAMIWNRLLARFAFSTLLLVQLCSSPARAQVSASIKGVVTDASGKLAGIFTHGDFVRAFEKNPAMVSDPVERHMVRHPITVQDHKLAVEVLNILDQHRIDDLIVVNENNQPVGIVDSQDLTKLKLL